MMSWGSVASATPVSSARPACLTRPRALRPFSAAAQVNIGVLTFLMRNYSSVCLRICHSHFLNNSGRSNRQSNLTDNSAQDDLLVRAHCSCVGLSGAACSS